MKVVTPLLPQMESKDLDEIIKCNTPRLRSYVRSKISNRDDADDIVQDTLYQLVRAIGIMDNPIGHVTTWLYTVAHNHIINHGKKHRETELTSRTRTNNDGGTFMTDISEVLVATDNDPEMQMLRQMVREELKRALAELPNEQRMATKTYPCENCKFRAHYEKNPKSLLGRFWR